MWQKKIIYLSHFLPKSHKIYNIISMNYRYIRVSTDKQTVENQRYEITEFAQKNGIQIDEWIEETISGTLEPNRRQLGTLLERKKSEGMILGHPKGKVSNISKLDGAEFGTTLMLMQGISVNRIANLYGVHRNTVKLFIKKKQLDSAENIQKVLVTCG